MRSLQLQRPAPGRVWQAAARRAAPPGKGVRRGSGGGGGGSGSRIPTASSATDEQQALEAEQLAAGKDLSQQQAPAQQLGTAPTKPTRRPRVTRGAAPPAAGGAADGAPLLTFEEVQAAAAAQGLRLTLRTLGPFYRIACREGDDNGRVLGVTSGFLAPPFKLAHCDMLQIFTRGLGGEEGARIRGGLGLGVALLLGGAVFGHAWAAGCTKAEILAINDDDAWHERLVRYYSFFGFRPVRTVGGNGLADLPHLLVWGGEGTRMDADVAAMLRKWGPAIQRGGAARAAAVAAAAAGGGTAQAGRAPPGVGSE